MAPVCSLCPGAFNPMMEDPLQGQRKTQLVLKIISGQQLPKPQDSMMGDRGEVRCVMRRRMCVDEEDDHEEDV